MAFAKIFENQKGDQLLLMLEPNNEIEDEKEPSAQFVDVKFCFETEGMSVSMKVGPMPRKTGEHYLLTYPQENAERILKDPWDFVKNMTGQ